MNQVLLLLSLLFFHSAIAKEVALTIDDAPIPNGSIYTGVERTKHIIDILKKEKTQVAFFCNPIRLNKDNGRERLQSYAEAGHIISNHTNSHPSINKVSAESYLNDINVADQALRKFSNFKPWFRFPYLKEGSTTDTRDRVRKHLKQRGYMNAYVTVDNYDYVIDGFVQSGFSKKLTPDLNKACEMLADLTLFGLEEQEKLAKKHLGESVRQVLLMHENDVEAFCLEHSIKKLRENHWEIISPVKAYEDPILSKEPDTLWLDQGRLAALVAAKDGSKYKSKWDNLSALNDELNRRAIVKGLKAE